MSGVEAVPDGVVTSVMQARARKMVLTALHVFNECYFIGFGQLHPPDELQYGLHLVWPVGEATWLTWLRSCKQRLQLHIRHRPALCKQRTSRLRSHAVICIHVVGFAGNEAVK